MSTFIHASAIVHPDAAIGDDCHIGPFCSIGAEVRLGAGVRLDSHVVIDGITTIGDGTHVYPFVSIGLGPQDLKYAGEATSTEIGLRNQIREFVTIHRGTVGGGGVTRIGDDNLLMAQAHVAHDCQVGNSVIMANAATLAGHVEIADRASVGAYSGVHQFCRVGYEAFVGGYSVVVKDALPFAIIQGNHAKCYGLNKVGMKRRGYSPEVIESLNHAFRLLLSSKLNTTQALERIRAEVADCKEVKLLLDFIEASKRGVVK
ncbi:MAG TPA: acyl-ACP--UDP-N-acetylglucosamine O-acyltransferase [Pyrinomonadaceae bacterium]|nr:acyl-ACP--UDP-N-acetylglucosamine O-acyltransferase [Chloracidobacterium sp.]MBP9107992.1 acyl-ACP--UDP-N-acetylglucosamine O-acyltransferase [Pyrinomonadaceae bacterium]MBK7801694.1 acyl-ACP--UDP-N-acetylglucosamine O-acyltransferase [Chloracidobacterium sp.]MBK9437011.1 acyl-ACP--UDP-N-acetylglucosamine O-acyltransferase [Chloracidobacterium sp.]MBL0242003.1 acyl-ACP--UDP-N-acetylglucosamine O-acyltransferase [Chloracidobacterium sp.]